MISPPGHRDSTAGARPATRPSMPIDRPTIARKVPLSEMVFLCVDNHVLFIAQSIEVFRRTGRKSSRSSHIMQAHNRQRSFRLRIEGTEHALRRDIR